MQFPFASFATDGPCDEAAATDGIVPEVEEAGVLARVVSCDFAFDEDEAEVVLTSAVEAPLEVSVQPHSSIEIVVGAVTV